MIVDIHELLSPELVNSVRGLELIAKTVAEGYVHGLNKSLVLGTGGEFSQYRSYEPGDDLRLIDWKLYGRSERYYTKLAEEDTNIKVKFMLDASNSMLHEQAGLSKFDFAKTLVAALGYVAFHQGDAIGVFGINDGSISSYPCRVQKLFSNFLYQLLDIEPAGKWPLSFDSVELLHQPGAKELIVLISDMYQKEDEIYSTVKRLKTNLNEVMFLQIFTKDELEFNYKGVVAFEDLETGDVVKVHAKDARASYLNLVKQYQSEVKDRLLDIGVYWERFVVGESLSETLPAFLKKRSQLL